MKLDYHEIKDMLVKFKEFNATNTPEGIKEWISQRDNMMRDDKVEWYEMEQSMRRPSHNSPVEIERMKKIFDYMSKPEKTDDKS